MITKRTDKNLRLQRQTLRTLTDAELAGVDGGRRNDSDLVCPPSKGAPCTSTKPPPSDDCG